MKRTDYVSKELRAIEQEIDETYNKLPLMEKNIATAFWGYLVAFERDVLQIQASVADRAGIYIEDFMQNSKYPLQWIIRTCPQGNETINKDDPKIIEEGKEMVDLGMEYQHFETAFTLGGEGILNLRLEGNTITVTRNFEEDYRYQVYGSKRKVISGGRELQKAIKGFELSKLKIGNQSEPNVVLNPRNIELEKQLVRPYFERIFKLPGDWELLDISLSHFRAFVECLHSMMSLHYVACGIRYRKSGNLEKYLEEIVYVASAEELFARMVRYSGIPGNTVKKIIDILTLGNFNQRLPDPALQPLICFNAEIYLLSPSLITASSFERNFLKLMNRIPAAKNQYMKLTDFKEQIMRENIIAGIGSKFSYFNGNIIGMSKLPDIDLAIIDNKQKRILFCELKYFIEPAEPREVFEKSKEIAHGIQQIKVILDAYELEAQRFQQSLKIDNEYEAYGVVISENLLVKHMFNLLI